MSLATLNMRVSDDCFEIMQGQGINIPTKLKTPQHLPCRSVEWFRIQSGNLQTDRAQQQLYGQQSRGWFRNHRQQNVGSWRSS